MLASRKQREMPAVLRRLGWGLVELQETFHNLLHFMHLDVLLDLRSTAKAQNLVKTYAKDAEVAQYFTFQNISESKKSG